MTNMIRLWIKNLAKPPFIGVVNCTKPGFAEIFYISASFSSKKLKRTLRHISKGEMFVSRLGRARVFA